jgi:hypothetical protein
MGEVNGDLCPTFLKGFRQIVPHCHADRLPQQQRPDIFTDMADIHARHQLQAGMA